MAYKIKLRRRREERWTLASRWAAVGTLAAYSAFGTKFNIALAQDITRPNQGAVPVLQTQGSQPVRRFDIPAGSLDSVLASFEQVTGISVTVSKEGIRSLSSPGVTESEASSAQKEDAMSVG